MCNRSKFRLVRMKWSSILMIVVLLSTWMTPVAVFAEPVEPVKAQAIAAGEIHTLVLKTDGTVVAWGSNNAGQTHVPLDLSGVKEIAAGLHYSLTLKSDGTVLAWGFDYADRHVLESLSEVIAIAAGGWHSLALKSDGMVEAWGFNDFGQANVPTELNEVIAIAAGIFHSLALKSDGTVVVWGQNNFGQTNVPEGLRDVIAIEAGGHHSLALKNDGSVVAWGRNESGQTDVPEGLSDVVAIAAGGAHSLALKSDGTVAAWGNNGSGQTNVPENLTDIIAIAAGAFHSLALKSDGTIVAWGRNDLGQATVPGSADLSGLSIDGTAVSPSFNTAVTLYIAYAGPSAAEVNVTATLEDTFYTALYINHQLAASGAATTVPLTGTETDITIRTEPYFKTGKTYTITVLKDITSPEVSFGTNGSETWSALAASTVTVTDAEGGVDPASLQYVWSTDTAVPVSGWISFTSGETLIKSGSDGDWYLHIQAADIFGNRTNTVSNRFRLDNSASTINLLSPQGTNVAVSASDIVLGFGEAVTGVENKNVTVSDGTHIYIYTIGASDNNISVTDSVYRATIPVTRFVNGIEPLSFKYDTEYSIEVEVGAYIDAAGNGTEPGNIGSFRTEKKTYIVIFKDWNETVLSTQTVTEGNKATLPINPVRGDYSFAGWYSDKAYNILFDFDTPITADQIVYAKWRKVENNGGSFGNVDSGSQTSANVDSYGVTVAGNTVTARVVVDSSGRAATIFTQGQITDAIDNALAAARQTNVTEVVVEIRIEAPASVNALEVSLSQAAIEAAAVSNIDTLILTTLIGTLRFDAKALNSIAEQIVSGVIFSVSRVDMGTLSEEIRKLIGDRPIYDFSITSGEKTISQFDGEVIVSVPYNPTEEELKDPEHITIWYIDNNGNVVSMPSGRYDEQTRRVTFTTNHFSRYAVAFVKKTFNDLESTTWAKKPIEVLASKGIMEGRRDEEFMPAAGITRAEYLSALVKILGVTAKTDACFDDVAIGSKYYEEIAIAKKLGITSGTGNNNFSPEAIITRQDMMVLTERALRSMDRLSSKGTSSDLAKFTDKEDVKNYAIESIAALVKEGLISGSNGRLNVKADTTRAEAAVLLYKLYGR